MLHRCDASLALLDGTFHTGQGGGRTRGTDVVCGDAALESIVVLARPQEVDDVTV